MTKYEKLHRAVTALAEIEQLEVKVKQDTEGDKLCTIQLNIIEIPTDIPYQWQSAEELGRKLTIELKRIFEPYRQQAKNILDKEQ